MDEEFDQPEMQAEEQQEEEQIENEEAPPVDEEQLQKDEGEPTETPESTPEEEAVQTFRPAPYTPSTAELPEEAYLREQFGDEALDAINRLVEARVSTATQSMAAASSFVYADAAENPELHRVHGAKINSLIAQLPANMRGTKYAVDLAKIAILDEETREGGDFNAAIQRMAALSGKNKGAAPASHTQPAKRVVPPSQRPPSPRSGGAPERGGEQRAGSGFLARRFGLRADLARDILDDIQE